MAINLKPNLNNKTSLFDITSICYFIYKILENSPQMPSLMAFKKTQENFKTFSAKDIEKIFDFLLFYEFLELDFSPKTQIDSIESKNDFLKDFSPHKKIFLKIKTPLPNEVFYKKPQKEIKTKDIKSNGSKFIKLAKNFILKNNQNNEEIIKDLDSIQSVIIKRKFALKTSLCSNSMLQKIAQNKPQNLNEFSSKAELNFKRIIAFSNAFLSYFQGKNAKDIINSIESSALLMQNTGQKGLAGEDFACEFLAKNGFEILKRNFFTHFGEIDIIAQKRGVVHFVEVKSGKNFEPVFAISPNKLKKLTKSIEIYCKARALRAPYCLSAVILYTQKDGSFRARFIENITI